MQTAKSFDEAWQWWRCVTRTESLNLHRVQRLKEEVVDEPPRRRGIDIATLQVIMQEHM